MKALFLYMLLFVNFVFSQDEKTKLQKEYDMNKIGLVNGFLLDDFNQKNEVNQNKIQQQSYVNVVQIGDLNASYVKVKSDDSQVDVSQTGSNNLLDIDKTANQIKESVFQNGNNNYISDYNYYSNQNVNQQFTQQGSELSLYNYGSNSISNNMSIIQTGNQKSIIVINR